VRKDIVQQIKSVCLQDDHRTVIKCWESFSDFIRVTLKILGGGDISNEGDNEDLFDQIKSVWKLPLMMFLRIYCLLEVDEAVYYSGDPSKQ